MGKRLANELWSFLCINVTHTHTLSHTRRSPKMRNGINNTHTCYESLQLDVYAKTVFVNVVCPSCALVQVRCSTQTRFLC